MQMDWIFSARILAFPSASGRRVLAGHTALSRSNRVLGRAACWDWDWWPRLSGSASAVLLLYSGYLLGFFFNWEFFNAVGHADCDGSVVVGRSGHNGMQGG